MLGSTKNTKWSQSESIFKLTPVSILLGNQFPLHLHPQLYISFAQYCIKSFPLLFKYNPTPASIVCAECGGLPKYWGVNCINLLTPLKDACLRCIKVSIENGLLSLYKNSGNNRYRPAYVLRSPLLPISNPSLLYPSDPLISLAVIYSADLSPAFSLVVIAKLSSRKSPRAFPIFLSLPSGIFIELLLNIVFSEECIIGLQSKLTFSLLSFSWPLDPNHCSYIFCDP